MKILIIGLLTGVGCRSIKLGSNKDLVFLSSKKEHVLHRLELFNDQTFSYRISEGLNETTSAGNWKIAKKKLYLNSFKEYKSGYSKISAVGENKLNNEYFNLFVVDNEGIPLEEALVFYGNRQFTVKKNGIVLLRRGLDTLVKVSFLGINYEASLHDISSENVRMEIVPLDLKKMYFDNQVWIIRGNTIISPFNKKLFQQ
ncbi:MAG: hypothetical protein KF741_04290 [Ferruginibacter sp.]|nr:hypothetical protein [Bacteroidota bacterium]MBX2918443.1 hypothetical protein [Ferruginibacter sp.]